MCDNCYHSSLVFSSMDIHQHRLECRSVNDLLVEGNEHDVAKRGEVGMNSELLRKPEGEYGFDVTVRISFKYLLVRVIQGDVYTEGEFMRGLEGVCSFCGDLNEANGLRRRRLDTWRRELLWEPDA